MRLPITSWREILGKLGLVHRRATAPRARTRRLQIEKLAARKMLAADLDSSALDETDLAAGVAAEVADQELPSSQVSSTDSAQAATDGRDPLDVNQDGRQ